MQNNKSIAERVLGRAAFIGTVALSLALCAACGGSQTSTSPATDASGTPDDPPMSGDSGSGSHHSSSSKDTGTDNVGDVHVSSAFDQNGEPIPGADGDISPDAKRPPKPAVDPSASASASAAPAAGPPKKGAGKK